MQYYKLKVDLFKVTKKMINHQEEVLREAPVDHVSSLFFLCAISIITALRNFSLKIQGRQISDVVYVESVSLQVTLNKCHSLFHSH